MIYEKRFSLSAIKSSGGFKGVSCARGSLFLKTQKAHCSIFKQKPYMNEMKSPHYSIKYDPSNSFLPFIWIKKPSYLNISIFSRYIEQKNNFISPQEEQVCTESKKFLDAENHKGKSSVAVQISYRLRLRSNYSVFISKRIKKYPFSPSVQATPTWKRTLFKTHIENGDFWKRKNAV